MDMRERITATLNEKGRSVRGVSIAAGMGETTLRNFLKGMTNSFTIESAEKVAEEIGVSAQWLIFGTGPKEPPAAEVAEVVNLWERIPIDRRDEVKGILEVIAKKGE